MAGGVKENRRLLSALELPPCEGPKLKTFPHRNASINWKELISEPETPLSSGQAYVFKVEINAEVYALKVFKFFKPSTYRADLGPIRGRKVTDEMLAFHTDPFYAECRAYAHIQEKQQEQNLRRRNFAHCYGFMALKKTDEEVVASYGAELWDIPRDDEYRRKAEGSPVRAIVKEYVDHDVVMDVPALKRMLKGIKWLNRHGVLNHDIHPANFKGGLLVDFGSSWTRKPHCLWDNMPEQKLKVIERADLIKFQEMANEEGFGAKVRAIPNRQYKELRPRRIGGRTS